MEQIQQRSAVPEEQVYIVKEKRLCGRLFNVIQEFNEYCEWEKYDHQNGYHVVHPTL